MSPQEIRVTIRRLPDTDLARIAVLDKSNDEAWAEITAD
jgi:hypothetical protein